MQALLLIFLTFQSPAEAMPTPASVPFEIIASKHMAVKITVNGKGPYRVIFDTGAPVSLLSGRVSKEAELSKGKEAFPPMFGMQGFFKVSELQLGELKAKDVQVIVMDHPTVKAISEVVGPIEGIIGFPFFAKYRTAINYQTKTLSMTPTTYEPGDVVQALMGSLMSGNKAHKVTLAPTTLWGLVVGKESSDTENGVEVVHIFPGGAAEKAGLKIGDRILVLDGWWTESIEDCYRAASLVKAGRTVKVKYRRDGSDKELTVATVPGV
jgi:hypothetical protein